ncbi:MAG: hypothetical protein KTR14_02535 [Vampirovibrio sp.]|nr:hypothetical protein [Vampirovibrio sp.]
MRLTPTYSTPFSYPLNPPTTPRFGLKGKALKEHPNFYRQLRLGEDVVRGQSGNLAPTQKLIQDVANVVLKDTIADPRALVITNITDFFNDFDYSVNSKDFEKVHTFQRDLFDAAWEIIQEKRYPGSSKKDFIFPQFSYEDGKVKEGQKVYRTARLVNKDYETQKTSRHVMPKQPHMDADDVLIGNSYGPIRNISGGNLTLFDYEHMMHDKKMAFHELFHINLTDLRHLYSLFPHQVDRNRSKYEVTVDTKKHGVPYVPLVFINNQNMAYGITPTHPDTSAYEDGMHKYLTYRVSAKPDRRTEYWQAKAPIPFHINWWFTGQKPVEKYPNT